MLSILKNPIVESSNFEPQRILMLMDADGCCPQFVRDSFLILLKIRFSLFWHDFTVILMESLPSRNQVAKAAQKILENRQIWEVWARFGHHLLCHPIFVHFLKLRKGGKDSICIHFTNLFHEPSEHLTCFNHFNTFISIYFNNKY